MLRHPLKRLIGLVGRAILPAAGFQPALTLDCLHRGNKSRLKGGYSQDWLPHVVN